MGSDPEFHPREEMIQCAKGNARVERSARCIFCSPPHLCAGALI